MRYFYILVAMVIMATATFAAEDCHCDKADPYVHWLTDNETALDEMVWRLVDLQVVYDLTLPGEPARCYVELEMIEHEDPVLYEEPFLEVPVGDFEVHFTGSFMLASEVEEVLWDTECFSLM